MKTLAYKFDTIRAKKDNQYIFQYIKNRKLSDIYHDHDFYELIFLLHGSCSHLINETEYSAQAQDFFLIRPGERHTFLNQSDSLELLCLSVTQNEFHVLADAYSPDLKEMILQSPEPIFIPCTQSPELHYIQSKAAASYNASDYKLLLFHLLKIFANHTSSKNDLPKQLQDAILEMRNRENIKRGIPAFLEISHYSQTHLSRILHKYFDMGLHDYILNLRLETAYSDLILTSGSLEEISESVGYNSFSHFNKIFKKKYGITPAVLRKEHGKPTI